MRMRAVLLAGVVLIAQPLCAWAQPAKVDLGKDKHFGIWLDAIDRHVPGTHDAAVRAMLELNAHELESVFPYMVLSLRAAFALAKRPFAVDDLFGRYGTRKHAPPDLAAAKEAAYRLLDAGLDRFLKRAAMLHADIGALAPDAHRSTAAGVGHLAQDGRGAGDEGRTWHWMLGRAFLHLVDARGQDPHVRLWYQATGNYLLETHNFTEAQPHLGRALELFANDAEIQFLRGFLHEAQAWPGIQAAVAAQIARMAPVERARYTPGVRSANAEHAAALEAFAKAVQLDANHDEARIRLGRALTLAGKPERATIELRAALERSDDLTLRYLAQMFLGRAEELRGRLDTARTAYEAAANLFPDAQSPRLALSQIEMQAGNREAAGALFAFLTEASEAEDPWWTYFRQRVPNREVWLARLSMVFAQEVK